MWCAEPAVELTTRPPGPSPTPRQGCRTAAPGSSLISCWWSLEAWRARHAGGGTRSGRPATRGTGSGEGDGRCSRGVGARDLNGDQPRGDDGDGTTVLHRTERQFLGDRRGRGGTGDQIIELALPVVLVGGTGSPAGMDRDLTVGAAHVPDQEVQYGQP